MTIKQLEERLAIAGSAATAAAMSVAGDSVDIWDMPRLYTFTPKSPTRFVTFAIEPDRNWEDGDVYTWHTRFVVPPQDARWTITAHYDDGAVELVQSQIHQFNTGRQELTIFTDSTRRATHIGGWLEVNPREGRIAVIDSVGLIRRRRYTPQGGRRAQRRIIPRKEYEDSVVQL